MMDMDSDALDMDSDALLVEFAQGGKRTATEQPWLRLVHGGPAQLQALKGTSPVDNEKLQEVLSADLRQHLPLLLGGALERAIADATSDEERSRLSNILDWLVKLPRPESVPLTGEEVPFKKTGAIANQCRKGGEKVLPLQRYAVDANTGTFPGHNLCGSNSAAAFKLRDAPFPTYVLSPSSCPPKKPQKPVPAVDAKYAERLRKYLEAVAQYPERLRTYRKCRKYLFAFLKDDLWQLPQVLKDLLDEKEVSGGKLADGEIYCTLSCAAYFEFEDDPVPLRAEGVGDEHAATRPRSGGGAGLPPSSAEEAAAAAEQPRRAAVGPAAADSSQVQLSAEDVGDEHAATRPRSGGGAEQPAQSAEEAAAATAAAGAAAAAAVAVMAAAGVAAAAAMAGVAAAAAMVGAAAAAAAVADSPEQQLLVCFCCPPGQEAEGLACCEQLLSGSLKGPDGDWQPLLQLSYELITKSARPLLHWLVFPPEQQLYDQDGNVQPQADNLVDYRLRLQNCFRRTLPRSVFLELLQQHDCRGATVLHRATACSDSRITSWLCGVAVSGQPPPLDAAYVRCLFIAAFSEGTHSGYNPLHEACRNGRTDNAVVLLNTTESIFGSDNMTTMVYSLLNEFYVKGVGGVGGDEVLSHARIKAGLHFKPGPAPRSHGDSVRLLRSVGRIIASVSMGG
ncbi:hypothetical protein FOA52_014669 [Chlamydomonas sp. UWO 241]|nr:hypothetical protein FOA52_014669 [Chlamydomonas sp. UWO 241]